jgi:hypothetical protein
LVIRFVALCIADIAPISLPARQINYLDAYAFMLYVSQVATGFRAGNRQFFGRIEKP